jgi:HD superfamily phosphohydrolase
MNDRKVFRDPIYKLISFHKEKEKTIIDLINTPEVQRLKRIRQLGFTYYTFPTGVHDRFSHSLGVSFLAGRMIDSLNIQDPIILDNSVEGRKVELTRDQLRLLVQIAGLLHDIGHGPFSHAFEKISGTKHEDLTAEIIRTSGTGVNKILSQISDELIRDNISDWLIDIYKGVFTPSWIKEIISSQLDADRLDYLLRDSYMCGVKYAAFDLEWLLSNLELNRVPTMNDPNLLRLSINGEKGIHAVESFIVSRYHMYEQVYYHKTTRGFEKLLQKIFERVNELKSDGKSVPSIDPTFESFIKDKQIVNFLILDDFYMLTLINLWARSSGDEILKNLCRFLIDREPYKMFKTESNKQLFSKAQYDKIVAILNEKFKYYFFEDDYKDNPYNDTYLLGRSSPEKAEQIWLKNKEGKMVELSTSSPIIKSITNEDFNKYRAYIHREFYSQVKNL